MRVLIVVVLLIWNWEILAEDNEVKLEVMVSSAVVSNIKTAAEIRLSLPSKATACTIISFKQGNIELLKLPLFLQRDVQKNIVFKQNICLSPGENKFFIRGIWYNENRTVLKTFKASCTIWPSEIKAIQLHIFSSGKGWQGRYNITVPHFKVTKVEINEEKVKEKEEGIYLLPLREGKNTLRVYFSDPKTKKSFHLEKEIYFSPFFFLLQENKKLSESIGEKQKQLQLSLKEVRD
ncbi:MAG: hypothetical protein DRI61_17405, partial [Chloroflexi bacterium]